MKLIDTLPNEDRAAFRTEKDYEEEVEHCDEFLAIKQALRTAMKKYCDGPPIKLVHARTAFKKAISSQLRKGNCHGSPSKPSRRSS